MAVTKYQHILDNLSQIINTIEQHLNIPDIHKKVDTFYYIEQSRKVKGLLNRFTEDKANNLEVEKNLLHIDQQVRLKWKSEGAFMTNPTDAQKFDGF
jgi:hypothetical protein